MEYGIRVVWEHRPNGLGVSRNGEQDKTKRLEIQRPEYQRAKTRHVKMGQTAKGDAARAGRTHATRRQKRIGQVECLGS